MRFRKHSRRSARTSGRFFKHARRHGGSRGIGSDFGLIGGAMAYGAGREWLSNKLQPITAPVAGVAGNYADEVVLGALGYFLMKGKIPVINKVSVMKDVGRAMVVIEAARIGQGVISPMLPGQTVSTAQANW